MSSFVQDDEEETNTIEKFETELSEKEFRNSDDSSEQESGSKVPDISLDSIPAPKIVNSDLQETTVPTQKNPSPIKGQIVVKKVKTEASKSSETSVKTPRRPRSALHKIDSSKSGSRFLTQQTVHWSSSITKPINKGISCYYLFIYIMISRFREYHSEAIKDETKCQKAEKIGLYRNE